MQTDISISVKYLKGVGPSRKILLENLGVRTIEDLLYLFPRRYDDRRHISPINKTIVGKWQTISGFVVIGSNRKSWHTKKQVTEIVLDDGTGKIFCVWFNQPYLSRYFKQDSKVICYGKIDIYKNRLQMIAPEYEVIEENEKDNLSTKRIVPVYPLTAGIGQRFLRKLIHSTLILYKDRVLDNLPIAIRNKYRFCNIHRSLESIHFPDSDIDQQEAIRRVSFEEFYFFQITLFLRRLNLQEKQGITHKTSDTFALKFSNAFSFILTSAQRRIIQEIRIDMQSERPMLRLIQGDVGSGKTVIAFFACLVASENGFQSCLMAPTEILAKQHFDNMSRLFVNRDWPQFKLALVTSSTSQKEAIEIYKGLQNGSINCLIGTHAVIGSAIKFKKLSVVVIDEQHKFGVEQRALLSQKGTNPHVLIMTATPIPRTLCITLYGDMDVSILDEVPPGRGKTCTELFSPDEDILVYDKVANEISKGRQAYIVYPIIDDNGIQDLKAAQSMFLKLNVLFRKKFILALVHGQMSSKDVAKVMDDFKKGEIKLLIATTILEVGVDVPNVSVMVIEHAERFGLSQLHQLRGRIGRGEHDAYCWLIGQATTEEGQKRLDAIVKTTDGFEIANQDLLIRGPGQYFGRHQHGLNELRVANPLTQLDTLELARAEARQLTQDDPKLITEKNKNIRSLITKRYPGYLDMITAG